MSPSSLTAVCLDLDGTLLRDGHADGVVRRVAGEVARSRPGLDPEALAAAHEYEWWALWAQSGDAWMSGRLTLDEVLVEVWRRALRRVGMNDGVSADDARRRHHQLDPGVFRPYDESHAVLAALRARGIRIAVVTNGPSAFQWGKLRAGGIESAVDAVIVSADVGVGKPDPVIFARALEALGTCADAALHVGDLRDADVAGARAAGMTAVWLDRAASGEPVDADAVIADLWGILPLLDRLGRGGRAT